MAVSYPLASIDNAAQPPFVTFAPGGQHDAQASLQELSMYNEGRHTFGHSMAYSSRDAFTIVPYTIPDGPFAGCICFVMAPMIRRSFELLPPELRNRIYSHVFPRGERVSVSQPTTPGRPVGSTIVTRRTVVSDATPVQRICRGSAALLLVDRLISAECRHFLYRGREFVFTSTDDFNRWTPQVGSMLQFITHISTDKTTLPLLKQSYAFLDNASSLKQLRITLSSGRKRTLKAHLDDHWEEAKVYFVGEGVSQEEAARRIGLIVFEIGSAQRNVLANKDGTVFKGLDAGKQAYCQKFLRKWVKRYAAD